MLATHWIAIAFPSYFAVGTIAGGIVYSKWDMANGQSENEQIGMTLTIFFWPVVLCLVIGMNVHKWAKAVFLGEK